MSGGANSVTISADMSGLDLLISQMTGDIESAARPAAQAGAQVLYEEVKRNVASIGKKKGNLARSIYQVYSETESRPGVAVYHVSWNARTAPHGTWFEYGHLIRYKMYLRADGQFRPMIRPSKQGTKPPKRRASQAVKDAYYVPLPTPVQVAARPFVRPAANKFGEAQAAAEEALFRRIDGGGYT